MGGTANAIIGAVGSTTGIGAVADAAQAPARLKRDAKREVKRQEAQFAEEQNQLNLQNKKTEMVKANAEQIRRMRSLRAKGSGRAGTILTEPLGSTGSAGSDYGAGPSAMAGAKTLLGS